MSKKVKIIRVSILIIMLIFSTLWINELYLLFKNYHDSNLYFLVYIIPSIIYLVLLSYLIIFKKLFKIKKRFIYITVLVMLILFFLGLINTYSDIARTSKNLFCIISFSILPYALYYAVDLGQTFFADFKENDDQL